MSGPHGMNEIEDFVSSVRRLVSVEARSRVTSRDLTQDRLVLTPALRIVTDAVLPEVPPGPEAGAETAATSGRPGHQVDPPAAPPVDAEWEEELWAEPGQPLAELALGAEEAEVIAEPAAPAPPGAGQGDEASPWAEVGADWLEDDAHVIANADVPEPVAVRPDVLRLTAEDMLTDSEGNPLTVLDEAALQQIIRQMIRDELKGVLGERITHSVRKLVRAEINRALAAHALD
jgi:hypothetical protein